MATKVKELDNLKEGDRNNCVICNPSTRLIREDKVWAFSQANPGAKVWKVDS